MRIFVGIALLMSISGCLASDGLVEVSTQSVAKSVIKSVVADKLPGVNADAAVDCVVDNASTDQLIDIAKASVTGIDSSTVSTVTSIAAQPQTIKCIAQSELSGLLG
jgi:hypothetical protein